jgi:nitrous oxide reductase accessory protein NosL
MSLHARWFLIGTTLVLAACDRGTVSGPPEIRLGSKECFDCGMLVSEDRCSTALLVEVDGRREYRFFDDLGCMLDHEREGLDGAVVVERFVHDFDAKAWIPAEDAVFVLGEPKSVKTPMGSGMIAFASREAAEDARRRLGGEVLRFTALVEARRLAADAPASGGEPPAAASAGRATSD